jgi:ABC-type uncharacterized transport system permease subunit
MSADSPSLISLAMTWLVIALSIVLLGLGVYWYGFSVDLHRRFWSDLADRIHGPMTFRFYLQPTMAALAALPDGINDARHGHKSFFWSALWNSHVSTGRLREGLIATARVVLLGLSMDVIYQTKVFNEFYPVEALMMALLLAVLPYFIFRWIVERVTVWWFTHKGTGHTAR